MLIWGLLAAGATLVLIFHLPHKKKIDEKITVKEGVYRIGGVNADTKKEKIWFKGRVFKDKGWVQHLVYLEGYKWLKDESAIISEARLIDLQRAIAILDWKLWDESRYGKTRNQKPDPQGHPDAEIGAGVPRRIRVPRRNQKLLLSIQWDEKEIPAYELVLAKDRLELGDFVFLGSPYFDYIALMAPPGVDCRQCPLFALEEKALRELFVRESGHSGYELNPERMPPCGTEVTIVIKGGPK